MGRSHDRLWLNYPMFLVTHKDIRRRPRVNAFFEFCLREPKLVLLHGVMGEARGGLAAIAHLDPRLPSALPRRQAPGS
jgi:hypothetical protein